MFYKSRRLPTKFALSLVLTLMLNSIALLAPQVTPAVQAETSNETALTVRVTGPSYGQAGQPLTYEVTIENLTSQTYTDLVFYNDVPANTTYVSGGALLDDGTQYVEFTLASLAPHASHTVSWVARANSGLAVGTRIDNTGFGIIQSNPGATVGVYGPVGTLVEAPGTLVAIYRNHNGTPFDVNVHGYQFANYGNDGIPNATDDLTAQDVFELFGPAVCQSGNSATTCKLSGPALQWLAEALEGTHGGHCDGMAATSLRLFNSLPFRQYSTPATFQSGAANTINLNFPAQSIENYITRYFHTQGYIWDSHFVGTPVQTVDKLIADFNKSPSVAYSVAFFLASNLDRLDESTWKNGHAVVAYGVEKVNDNEYRILVYDNNFPKQRKYFTVNRAANTWRYVTASTPGEPEDAYAGTAFSLNLHLVPLSARDLPTGQYFPCPFCPNATVVSAQLDPSALIAGELDFKYTGEGAFLIVNDAGQKTGDDHTTGAFVNEIPGAEVFHFQGGLGKEIPPFIGIPFEEHDETFYQVFVHGTTIETPTTGTLAIHGPGFSIGVNDIELDAGEVFEFGFSPDGDHLSFTATETITAPEIYIAHDPLHPGDPSIVFDVEGVTLLAGERILLDLDPVLERIHFDHTGPEGENFVIDMKHIWPDGDEQKYAETIHVPAGATNAFIDFGAWDGLLHPPIYISDTLQNPAINHRLMLAGMSGVYEATPQANAPAGVYHAEATFTNVTEVQLTDLYFTVADLAAGNVLLNADGSPAGAGAKLSLSNTALGDDGLLYVNESVTVRFSIGLANAVPSTLTVDANGVPHDWTHEAPPLAGEANNASFVLPVRADNPLYLPLVAK